tara:strand:- start:28 stop:141 length:114 start_codon:yes stop_codon:yes gene_type:complete
MNRSSFSALISKGGGKKMSGTKKKGKKVKVKVKGKKY